MSIHHFPHPWNGAPHPADTEAVPALLASNAVVRGLDLIDTARLPNQAWLDFLDGPLSADDWQLIGCVERGEISVDQAMTGRAV